MHDNIEIGRRIRDRRKELGMTLQDVARAANVAASTVQRYEAGKFDRIKLPVLEAIADALKVNPEWLSLKTDDLRKLEPLGPVDDVRLQSRYLDIYPYKPTHRIPILGRISAGLPLYADENIEGYMVTELNGGAEYFALRVKGDSMTAARIFDGDILVVRRQDQVENGQIAVVLVNGDEATVKKFYRNGSTVILVPQSLNPEHQTQVYDATKTVIKVLGLVVQNIINF